MCSIKQITAKYKITNSSHKAAKYIKKSQTWNHLACRRAARASRHFCLSKTSGGSLTVTVDVSELIQAFNLVTQERVFDH